MAGAFITTTSRSELRPLASQGIFVTDCFHQVNALLQSISPQHATLLAEPVHSEGSAGRESIDWYAHELLGHGTALAVTSLPEEQRNAALQRVHTLAQDVSAKAESLIQSGDNQNILSGEILKFALQHPSENDIWLMNGHPVVLNWGFAPGTVGAKPEDLTRVGYTPVVAPVVAPVGASGTAASVAAAPTETSAAPIAATTPAAAPVAASRRGCLPLFGWLLPLLLFLLLLLLLLSALGLFKIPFPAGCTPSLPEVDLSEEIEEEKAKGDELLSELEALRKQLEEKALLCIPPKAEIPPQKPQEPEVIPPVEEPVTEPPFFGQEEPPVKEEEPTEPPLTEPFLAMTPEEEPEPEPQPEAKPEPKPEKKQEPKPEKKPEQKPQKDEPLRIPDNAREENDLSFLEGCWRSVTDLFNSRTGEPVVTEYCFDKSGQGRQIIREQDGRICTGGVEAQFGAGGSLTMKSFPARCPDGNSYVPETVQCTGSDNSTNCKGTSTNNGRRNQWDARFYRK